MGNRQESSKNKVNILWLDANVNNPPNDEYQNEFKKIEGVEFNPFTETNDCIEIIKKIRYEKTFIIISGSILKDFYNEFKKIIKDIEILPEILIFTSNRRLISVKKDIPNLNFPLFDVNSVFTYFDAVEKRLKMENLYIPKTIEPIKIENDETFCFEYIKEKSYLNFPLNYTVYIEYPTKNEISNFNKFLLNKFSNFENFKFLIQQLILNIKIPCEILVKYYLRAYTLESDFYKEMNYYLERKSGKDYETYIKVVYYSLLKQYIKPNIKEKLYRGTRIKKDELEYIKKAFKNKKEGLPACICYCKAFLSSSSKEKIALDFMIRKQKTDKEEYVIFEFEKGTELDNQDASNSIIEKISEYDFEKETLFFPFSSFEIIKLSEEITYIKDKKYYIFYRIYLNYLGKYRKIIDPKEKSPETEYTKNFFKTEIVDKFELVKYKEKFSFDVEKLIPEEKRKNYIQAVYEINNNDINKNIRILNSSDLNKEEIKKLCNIYLNDKKIDFGFEYKFDKIGNYTFEFEFINLLTNTSNLFYNCKSLISLDFNKFKTNNITDMSDMFNGCSLLKSLDLSNFKTNQVTNMKNMFCDCTSLNSLDVSSFNTVYVTDMSNMFCNCDSLPSLDLSNFKTKSVETMNRMFYNCKSLNYLNISNFTTELVKNMSEMFSLCSSLNSLDLSKFETFNVTEMNKMFYQCSSLTSVNVNNFITENVNTMENMFTDCTLLTSLDLSSFDTKKVTNMKEMFKNCTSLQTLNIKKFDNLGVKNMKNIFTECKSLITLIMSRSFRYNKNAFEDLNNKVKIIYEDTILNNRDIIDFFNDYDKSEKENNSVVSTCTNKYLLNIFKDYVGNKDESNNNSNDGLYNRP